MAGQRWRIKNPKYSTTYRNNNIEKCREYTRNWRNKNIESERRRIRQYEKDNPERMAIHASNRRALLANLEGTFTRLEWTELCNFYGNKCLACGEKKKLTIDHIVPVTKGGRNDITNIQPLCKECNISKFTKIVDYRGGKYLYAKSS